MNLPKLEDTLKTFVKRVFGGDKQGKRVRQLTKRAEEIGTLEADLKKKTDAQLKKRISEIKKEIQDGKKTVDNHLNEVFAITREMSVRTLEMRHFDVQLIGGIVMHEGDIAEMRTGEGKTLVATLPLTLNALEGKGAHLVTVNDYLAKRDAGWMAELYSALGLSVGVIAPQESFIYDPDFTDDTHDDERLWHLKPCSRQEAYAADITYGTNNEFGFDYLRDNMVGSIADLRQRELHYAIVDEVDSILIDEARTPLIISRPASASSNQYEVFAKAVKQLNVEKHMDVDEKQRSAALTDEGVEKIQKILGIENLYDPKHVQAVYHLDQAVRAQTLFKRDKNYVVRDGEVIIVDEFTGRLMFGRRYSEGLHQAIEAKEGVNVLQESSTLATISFQNYFRLYTKLAGMTGTAETESEEFYTIYKLDVAVIPTNKPIARVDAPDRIYKTEKGKFKAIVEEVKERQAAGQPVLIGTASVEKNEYLSHLLTRAKIDHEVLNAKNNAREAAIVAKAGEQGAVTLATNIAGRGTDIKLAEGVKERGGLHVIGTERHESRRIDNQLRGRSGRQGDPGSTQFYVSAEDELIRIFSGERMGALMERFGVDDDTPIENKTITKVLESAQKKVENFNYDSRKNVVKYDDVMNRHRKATYGLRREILEKDDISDLIKEVLSDEVDQLQKMPEPNVETIVKDFTELVPVEKAQLTKLKKLPLEELDTKLTKTALSAYKKRTDEFGEDLMKRMEREVYLSILDDLWMQHLENMQHLREGIGLRSVGQRDPLVEYRREGQIFFEGMMSELRTNVVRLLFRLVPRVVQPEQEQEVETELTRAAENATAGGGDQSSKSKTQQKRAKRAKKPTPPARRNSKKSKKKKKR